MDHRQQNFKAIVSNSGDEALFQALSGEVERRLPTSSVSWKRSFGRPSKEVVLQANFMKFDSSKFPSAMDSASTLISEPLLHIFWTSCLDNDKYKSAIKNNIMKWQKIIIENQCADWLIVHVVYQDNTKPNKSKINLPRSSVYDKIRAEFCQKFQDRCIQLWEPDKETLFTKSGESWDALLTQLRNLLLVSFGRHLDSFEDRIRVMREKYADPEWSFIDYFVVHEELALIYQSITLRDDALVQYDEVDALLSQFIINCGGRELPRWLQKFSVTPTNWDGVSLGSQNMESYKTLIKSGNASLIDFRNYLFARQCKLLIAMIRKSEIPSRLMEFVYMVVQELKLLNIDIHVGCVACWAVLTCMQLFQIVETVEDKDYEFQSLFAHMYDYMRQKFHYLGEITGLYYNRVQTDEEVKLSELVTSGFGKYPSRKTEMPSSIKLLKAALCSKDAYETLYLDISNKTIQLMTKMRRLHFGMCVGIDLAKFHLQYGRYNDAEMLLEKAWSIYKQQKWESLYTDVLIPLADCQLKHNLTNRYLNSVMLLSCAKCLPLDTRNFYCNELLKLSMDHIELPVIGTDPVIKILDIHINLVKNKGHIGDLVQVTLELRNQSTVDLPCKSIYFILKHSDLSNPKSFSDGSPSSRTPANTDSLNSDVYISLLSEEKPKEISKEPLTPSSLLKKIKSHKRTWSKNRNVIDSKNNSQNNSVTSSPSESRSASISYSIPDGHTAKKSLFSEKEGNKDIPNGELRFSNDHFTRCSSLQDINIKSSSNDLRSSSVDLRPSSVDLRPSDFDFNSSTSDVTSSKDAIVKSSVPDVKSVDINVKSCNADIQASSGDIKSSNGDVKSCDTSNTLYTDNECVSDAQFADPNIDKPNLDRNSTECDVKTFCTQEQLQHSSNSDIQTSDVDHKSNCVNSRSSNGEELTSITYTGKQVDHSVAGIGPAVSGDTVVDGYLGQPLATSSVSDPPNICIDAKTNESISTEDIHNISSSDTCIASIDNIFVEPELEENLDQMLVSSENVTLTPGYNSIELKSKINIEGKFVIQSMNCLMGNLKFFKLLTQLSRDTKAFFMVADPPKIVWTTDHLVDYLLTGCKQRLHVTLLNGPGMILSGSAVRITSHSGLQFQDLSTSSIQIYPLERDGVPHDAVISGVVDSGATCTVILYMPECKPYERVNMYLDVIAPIHSNAGDNHMIRHDLEFNCLWLKGLVDSTEQLDCIFYEPFQMDYETLQKMSHIFVKVILRGVNPVLLNFLNPKLSTTSNSKLSFQLLSENNLSVDNIEEGYFLWQVDFSELDEDFEREKLNCQFEVNFNKTKEGNGTDVGCFCKQINIAYTRCLYSVEVSMATGYLKKSQPCSATVTIRKLHVGSFPYRLFLVLNTEKQIWNYTNSCKYHKVEFDSGSSESSLVIDISCEIDGSSVASPVFLLAKLKIDETDHIKDVLEGITSFEYGQVEYKHSGQIIFYNTESIVSAL